MSAGDITLVDVARDAGVSPSTASRALHGPIERVSEQLRSRVEQAALRLGYSADRHAQLMARGGSWSFIVVVDDLANPLVAEVAAGIVDAAHDRAQTPVIRVLPQDGARRIAMLREVRGERPMGVIAVLGDASFSDPARQHLAPLDSHGVPVAVVDASVAGRRAREFGRESAEGMIVLHADEK